jgi:hypothetical protein
VNDEIDQILDVRLDDLIGIIRADIMITRIDTAYGRTTINYMLSDQNRFSYLTDKWKAGQFDVETKRLIHAAVKIRIEERENR